MTPEEMVKWLREWVGEDGIEAADLIERQAKEIEYLKMVKEAIDKDWDRQAKALEEAEKALTYAIENQEWSHEETTLLGEALATIHAIKAEK